MEWCSSSGDFNARIGKIFELTSLIQLYSFNFQINFKLMFYVENFFKIFNIIEDILEAR